MKQAMLGAFLVLATIPATAQTGRAQAYIRQVDYAVVTCDESGCTRQPQALFMLYVGSPETERLERLWAHSGVERNVSLVHPVADSAGPLSDPAGAGSPRASIARWYVSETDTTARLFRRSPLLNRTVWSFIPGLARQALLALGPDDDRLILISWNGISGSLSIYYAPQVQTDRPFYEKKLAVLVRYLDDHRWGADEPYELIDPAGTFLAFSEVP